MHIRSLKIKLLLTSIALLTLLTIFYLLAFKHTSKVFSATAGHIVISEVQISGDGGVNDEFVELYNPTGSDVTMDSWRLTRKNSSGTEANLVLSLYGTIPAHGFFLITDGDGYNGATSADANYSATSNQMTNNYTVLLYSDTGTTLVDEVGFGSAADYEGTPFPDNPATDGSIERKPGESKPNAGNGEDTDDNSTDFSLRDTSEPQNSNSPIEVPATPTPTEPPTPSEEVTPTEELSSTPIPTEEVTPTEEPKPTLLPTPQSQEHILGLFPFRGTTTICRMTMQKFRFFFSYMYFPQITCNRVLD
jgi:hypothetical protein